MKKRYIVYICLILLLLQSLPFVLSGFLKPVLPVIQLPGEIVAFRGAPFFGGLTNTFIAALLTFFLLLLMAIGVRAGSRSADEVPTGFFNFIEYLLEMMYGYVENAAGKWAKTFFPFFATFILWIVVANWMELIPGVDSVGKWESMGELAEHRFEAEELAKGNHPTADELHHVEDDANAANVGDLRLGRYLISRSYVDADADSGSQYVKNGKEKKGLYKGRSAEAADWTLVPFVRAAATDLNFTLAVALISVIMTQYYGMKAQGAKYWGKFFTWNGDEIKKNPLAVINTGVGLLEFISEVFKIVSFAFRLLGNIFAGQVLLFVIGSLVPVANLLFYFLEFGIGALQGVVFALLTLTFMKGATEEVHH